MLYAAYGSNLHPLRLEERLASARLVGAGLLPGWALAFHKRSKDGSGKCSIQPGGGGVYLAIFDISARDKLVLDRIEGVGRGYSTLTLNVPEFGDCASYTAEPSHIDNSLAPYDWYKSLVLLGAAAHRFPADYRQAIETVASLPDPDIGRASRAEATIASIRKNGTP